MQRQSRRTREKETVTDVEQLQKRFEETKSKSTRIVTLIYTQCVCCECTEFTVQREVANDSDLKDGDDILRLKKTDVIISRKSL